MMARLQSVARELGLPLGERGMTYNSRLAQEMGKWAEDQGLGHEFHIAAFRSYFADGRNIAETEVLLDLAGSVGLSREDAEGILADRTYREAVDADWERSRSLGVTAVPTFLTDGSRLVGAQPYEPLERMVVGAGAKKR